VIGKVPSAEAARTTFCPTKAVYSVGVVVVWANAYIKIKHSKTQPANTDLSLVFISEYIFYTKKPTVSCGFSVIGLSMFALERSRPLLDS
jgi:hypothetical protein